MGYEGERRGEERRGIRLDTSLVVVGGGLVHDGVGVAVAAGGLGRVDGRALVGHVGDEAVVVVGGVSGRLDAAVGQGDHERAGDVAAGVLRLGLLEVGLAVVVVDAVLVRERLLRQLLLLVGVGRRVGGAV